MALLIAGVSVGGGIYATVDTGGGDEPASTTTTSSAAELERRGSVVVDGADPVTIGDEPSAYHVRYRITLRGSSDRFEEITVRRPFTSETVALGPDNEVTGVQRASFGRLVPDASDDDPLVFAVGPAPTSVDVRLAPVLDDALERGWLEPREVREVDGTRCQVYRSWTTLAGGVLVPPGDPAEEYVDVCVDGRGLVLEEWWVLAGVPLRQRLAVEVRERVPPQFGAGWSDEQVTLGVDRGGGSVRRIRADSSPPGRFFEVGDVPDGFDHVGRYTVVPPQADAFDASGDRSRVVASTTDVWQRGIDVLVVDQGGSLGGTEVFPPDPDNPTVEVRPFGDVELVFGVLMNEVRVHREVGRFVRVMGTLPHDALLDVVRSLVEVEGNELVVDDGPLLPSD